MSPLDEAEQGRWRAHADDELRVARHNADGAFHHVAVLHAEQAAQFGLKALLRGVGGTEQARGHYGPADAERAIETARAVLERTDAAWASLSAAAQGDDDADPA